MPKYRTKPVISEVEANIYKEGMGLEDGWEVEYCNITYSYREVFDTKEEALKFIDDDMGRKYCNKDDKDRHFVYEDPAPIISNSVGDFNVSEGDYIVEHDDGEKEVLSPEEFNDMYEPVNEQSIGNIVLNVTINQDSVKDVENTIKELQNKLNSLRVNFAV